MILMHRNKPTKRSFAYISQMNVKQWIMESHGC